MGSSAFNIVIENTFNTSWGSTTPIKFDNVPFDTPSTAWVAITVWDGKSNKASLGINTQLRRSVGTVFIDIYTPVGAGSAAARTYADQVKTVFRDVNVSGLTFYEGTVSRLGEKYYTNSGTGVPATSQWYQLTVGIPFKYDEYI